jgi:hypothetical protein
LLVKLVLILSFLSFSIHAKSQTENTFSKNDTNFIDPEIKSDSIKSNITVEDTLNFQQKEIFSGNVGEKTIKVADEGLDAPIDYLSEDSFNINMPDKVIHLYGNAQVNYKDIQLNAERIDFYWELGEVVAFGVYDSIQKKMLGNPVFTQAGETYIAEHFRYNFKTKKGKSRGMVLKESEGYLHGMEIKSIGEDVIYGKKARYTTCNLEHPHFYIEIDQVKILKDKIIVGKPANLVLEDVRTPLWLPFGMFPLMKNRNSGFLQPQFQTTYSDNIGFGIRQLGFFFALNDKLGLTTYADVFTHGNYNLFASLDYRKRYAFNGQFAVRFSSTISGERQDPEFAGPARSLSINWNLTVDPKKLNNASFNVSTNIQSRGFNKNLVAQGDTYLNNDLNSSISYSKNWPGKPVSLSLNAKHNQNLNTGVINLTVPSFALNMSNIKPFEGLSKTGKKWYDDIFLTYNMQTENRIRGIDSTFFSKATLEEIRSGMRHTASLGTRIKLFKYINITPSFSYNEFWYPDAVNKTFSDTLISETGDTLFNQITEDRQYGFKSGRDFNISATMSWALYGTWNFKRTKNVKAFRHVMRPNLGFSYRPDFTKERWGFYKTVQTDTLGNTNTYSIFEDGIYGGPTSGENMVLRFNVTNDFEMKIRSSNDTITGMKKIKLLNGLNIGSSVNFLADSLRLSDFTFSSGSTEIYKGINFNFSGILSPYYTDPLTNRKQNTWLVKEKGRLVELKSFRMRVSGTFQSKKQSGNPNAYVQPIIPFYEPYYNDPYLGAASQYVDFSVPWSFNIDYNLTINRNYLNGELKTDIAHSSNLDVKFNLTPKWAIDASIKFNYEDLEINYAKIGIKRDLHCWFLFVDWYPVGRQSIAFGVRVRASQLSFLNKAEKAIPQSSTPTGFGF